MCTNSSTPPCTRTLTRYSEYKRTNSVWWSPPFYSGDKGYKLELMVNVNSFGSDKGSHLFLHVYPQKGEYDDQLQWPFNAIITIQLLNWSRNKCHEEKTIPHHATESKNQTRVTERSYNFISCSVLESVSSDTRYINEDSVCFRIVNVEIISLIL